MKTKLLLLTGFLGITLTSCDKEEAVFYHFDEPTFTAKQKQWEEQNIKNYKFDQYYMSSATDRLRKQLRCKTAQLILPTKSNLY